MHLAGGSVQSNVYRRFDTWNDSRDIFRVFLTWVETTDNGLFCVKGHALFLSELLLPLCFISASEDARDLILGSK